MKDPVTVDSCYPAMRMVKRLGPEVDLQPATGAEVKTEWICTSAPPICLNGADRDSCTVCHFHAVDGMQRNI
jgi:hypothetical protein